MSNKIVHVKSGHGGGGRQEGGDGRQGHEDGVRSLFRGFDDKLFTSFPYNNAAII